MSVLLSAPGLALAEQAWRLGPDHYSLRHPTDATIHVFDTSNRLPALRFFATVDLEGTPLVVVDVSGLWIDGVLRCPWTEWADGERMLAEACSGNLPVSTAVSDAGLGSPELILAMRVLHGSVAELRSGATSLFIDLATLPGDPRPGPESPRVDLPRKGHIGWEWLDSQVVRDRREGHALALRLQEPAFARFYHGIRSCLLGTRPACLTAYLDPTFAYRGEPSSVRRMDFARFARQTPGPGNVGSVWEEIAWCFLRGRVAVDRVGVTFYRKFLQCHAVWNGDSYALKECSFAE